jgi:pSer/pThr/pTyr-binding forkhead associated (FHA) protein
LTLGFLHQWTSIRHAGIERCIGGFWLSDDGSKNGVLINGGRIDSALLGWRLDRDRVHGGCAIGTARCRRAASDVAPGTAPAALETALLTLDEPSRTLEYIARSAVSLVLMGETGIGKEVDVVDI